MSSVSSVVVICFCLIITTVIITKASSMHMQLSYLIGHTARNIILSISCYPSRLLASTMPIEMSRCVKHFTSYATKVGLFFYARSESEQHQCFGSLACC